jgi:membrane-associated phospholipid phosphatase
MEPRGAYEHPVVRPVVATVAVAFACYVALVAIALTLGALVTHYVVGGAIGRADLDVARWFADQRTTVGNDLSRVGSGLGETVTVVVGALVLLTVTAVRRHWPLFGFLAVAFALEPLVYLVTTYVISRDRPAVPRLEHLIVSDSFPSGHTAAAVVLYGSIAVLVWAETRRTVWRTVTIVLVVVGPLVVATSRVYRGMHNPTDVLAGALLGAGCLAAGYVAALAGVRVARADDGDLADDADDGDDGDPTDEVWERVTPSCPGTADAPAVVR